MSINIRGSLLVVAGTFLFKVITIEHTNSKVFFTTIRSVTLQYGRDGRMYTEICESNRPPLSSLIAFFGGVGRGECIDVLFSDWMCQSPGSQCALGQHLEGNWWLEQNLEDLWGNIMKDLSHWSLKWQLCLSAALQLSHFIADYEWYAPGGPDMCSAGFKILGI